MLMANRAHTYQSLLLMVLKRRPIGNVCINCARARSAVTNSSGRYLGKQRYSSLLPSTKLFSTTNSIFSQGTEQHSSQEDTASNQNEETQYEYDVKQRILAASLAHVQEHGWTQKALEAGAKDEGLPAVAHGMFPQGGVELVFFFYTKCNSDLASILKSEVDTAKAEGRTPKINQLIRGAVETRLRMIIPYIDSWPQAMAMQTLPQNAPESWKNALNLMDEIWFYAGDRSTDFNWYTKRMSLYGVYKATEIYMLQDSSEDKVNTWAFLGNRLSDLQKLGECKRSCEQNSDVFKEAVKGLTIMGRNVLGFNSRDR